VAQGSVISTAYCYPLDFHIVCDFVRPQISAYYHFLRFQSYSHCSEIRRSDGLQFISFGSTLGFVLLKGETETPLPTPPHLLRFCWFASVAERPTAHHFLEPTARGSKVFFFGPAFTIDNTYFQLFANRFYRYISATFSQWIAILPTTFSTRYSHTILVGPHIETTNTSSTTSSPLPTLMPSPITPLIPTLVALPPSPTTPVSILYTMATVPKTMPARGHATAPKFISSQPRELPRYFNELNNLFQDANITDEGIKKAQACRYVDIDESELWQVLPEYTNNSYDKWKNAVLTLYPGAMEDCKWSMADLDQLLGSTSHMGIMNLDEYAEYYRKFFTITQFLIGKLRLSESEQRRLFLARLSAVVMGQDRAVT